MTTNQKEIEKEWFWGICATALESDTGWKSWKAGRCYYKSSRKMTFSRSMSEPEQKRLANYFASYDCANKGQEWGVTWASDRELELRAGIDSSD